jgi:hypothetical protein
MQNIVGYAGYLGQAKDGYSLQYQVDKEGLTVEREGLKICMQTWDPPIQDPYPPKKGG